MSLLDKVDSRFKDLKFDSVKVHHGGYDSVIFYTVAVLRDGTNYYLGLAKVNIVAGDQFSRPLGRKIALGRALQQAAVDKGLIVKLKGRLSGTVRAGANALAKDTADAASLALGQVVPEFLFKEKA